ncbi:MAG: 1-deoxy-D-xylulose-5-phosphate reductoisomerase [Phycisphaerales bacterium]
MHTKRVILLGSTGSIGTQTIEVVRALNAAAERGESAVRYRVVGLATGRNADAMFAQAAGLGVTELALASVGSGGSAASAPAGVTLRTGADAAARLVEEVEADVVVGAMVGSAGIPATLAALRRGVDVALANKETLVAAGAVVVEAARRSGAKLLPIDSEHSGLWQCLSCRSRGHEAAPFSVGNDVRRVVLTASGGALRSRPLEELHHASVEEALAHPTWNMGAKVTIDSASLTNKALEVIEAHWLFGLDAERICVLVHPQSVVHAMVEFADASVIAQLGAADMRTPIQYAMTFPARPAGVSRSLDFAALSRLEFSPPDARRYPALELGHRVIREGGTSGAVFNAANEAAVEAFLARKIAFGRIAELSRAAMDEIGVSPLRDLADAQKAEEQARRFVGMMIA